MKPILFVFSGLPGSGKTVLARKLAEYLKSTYLRLDTIEQGIRELCMFNIQGEGYRLTYRIVEDNLRIGNTVVVDCCNPWNLIRDEWEEISKKTNSNHINLEIKCSDRIVHQSRISSRKSDITGLVLPTWSEVENRKYEEWNRERILVDTSCQTEEQSINEMMEKIEIEMKKYV